MDKESWLSFPRFLNETNDGELTDRIDKTNRLLQRTCSADLRSDARQMIRLMEQELLARSQARAVSRKK